MKRQVLIVVVAAILIEAATAASSGLPKVRSHGDPDEFQSRQVLDEGFAVRDWGPLTDTGGGPVPPQGDGVRPKSAERREARNLVSPSFSIHFSGRTVFLER